MIKRKKEKLEEQECSCTEECTCGENCNCTTEDKCSDACTCGEEWNCGDDCNCGCQDDECSCNESEKIIEDLNKQNIALKEALLRNQAELQNYKRRKEEETERFLKYKHEDLLKELLTIVDNFERAISMDDIDLSDEVSKFLSGFKLIYGNTVNILNKYEVKEIADTGVEFDANYHHAVLTEHDDNKPEGVVLEILQKGYIYKDRVIRPAMVKVNE